MGCWVSSVNVPILFDFYCNAKPVSNVDGVTVYDVNKGYFDHLHKSYIPMQRKLCDLCGGKGESAGCGAFVVASYGNCELEVTAFDSLECSCCVARHLSNDPDYLGEIVQVWHIVGGEFRHSLLTRQYWSYCRGDDGWDCDGCGRFSSCCDADPLSPAASPAYEYDPEYGRYRS